MGVPFFLLFLSHTYNIIIFYATIGRSTQTDFLWELL